MPRLDELTPVGQSWQHYQEAMWLLGLDAEDSVIEAWIVGWKTARYYQVQGKVLDLRVAGAETALGDEDAALSAALTTWLATTAPRRSARQAFFAAWQVVECGEAGD